MSELENLGSEQVGRWVIIVEINVFQKFRFLVENFYDVVEEVDLDSEDFDYEEVDLKVFKEFLFNSLFEKRLKSVEMNMISVDVIENK